MTGDHLFLFHVIGDVSKLRVVILGMLVTRDESYFLVIMINSRYLFGHLQNYLPIYAPGWRWLDYDRLIHGISVQ